MLILNTGTQYVEGVLSFDSGFQIFLYDSVFSQTGDYVLFDYSAGSFPGGQIELNNNVSVTAVDLKLSYLNPLGGITVLEDQPEHNRIVVKLLSKPENGKQWVDGDLVFTGPTTLYLDQHLFATQGVYELFEVTGGVFGIENLSVIHDGGWLIGAPYIDPNNSSIVKISLVKAIGVNSSNISQAFAISPEIVQLKKYLRPTHTTLTSEVFSPSVQNRLNLQNSTSVSFAYSPVCFVNISPETTTINSVCYSPNVKQKIIIPEYSLLTASCESPLLKKVTSPSNSTALALNPNIKQYIKPSFTSVISSLFRLRTGDGESFWYDYFPLASFEGKILESSSFKICLLGSQGGFVSTHRYISDIPDYSEGITQTISLNRTYINNKGEAIYEFDPVVFNNLNFTFENAVVYANNILILHINWARPFVLQNQSITIEVPRTDALARPETNFGTLEFEGYIENPATAYSRAFSPFFPYLYPETAFSIAKAIPLFDAKADLNTAFCFAYAFSPSISSSLDEIFEPSIEIELEDYAFVECFAFDTECFQKLKPEIAFVDSFAFSPKGPASQYLLDPPALSDGFAFSPELNQEIKPGYTSVISQVFDPFVEGNIKTEPLVIFVSAYAPKIINKLFPTFALSNSFAFNPLVEQNILLSYAFAYATSYGSVAEQNTGLQTAFAFALPICSPVIYQPPVIQPEPPQPPVIKPIKCADPFYETKVKKDPRQKSSLSELIGYWNLDGKTKDSSFSRKDLEIISIVSEEVSDKFEDGVLGQSFRGKSFKENNIVYPDSLISREIYSPQEEFSVQVWFKVDHDSILLNKSVSYIEQMLWCWSGSGPSFPGSTGWSIHSTESDNQIVFQFNIVDSKSRFAAIASLEIGSQFTISNTWHHLVGTKKGNEVSIYVDGIKFGDLEGERIVEGDDDSYREFNIFDGTYLRIGSSSSGYVNPLLSSLTSINLTNGSSVQNDSSVDEVAIWKKHLTEKDVKFLWLGGLGNIASDLPAPLYSIDTSKIDSLRQGVELTQQKHFSFGNYKIYSGDRKSHRWVPNVFGLSPVKHEGCFTGFKDRTKFSGLEYVTNSKFNSISVSDSEIKDGVIKVLNGEINASINADIFQTIFMIGEYPILPYKDGFNESEIVSISPFDDNVDNLPQIGGSAPYEYRSQSSGYDYNAKVSVGTDSIAFGGMNY